MKMTVYAALMTAVAMTLSAPALAHVHGVPDPDDHAPIGVMGDHTHKTGEWMVSYRYARMDMRDARAGTTDLTTTDVLAQGFMMAPTKMNMEMHMFGAMYAPSDRVTFMAMVPMIDKEMEMRNAMGMRMTMDTFGIGDAKLAANVVVFSRADMDRLEQLHINLGLSAPTGSIDETNAAGQRLGYPMQLGTGTVDPTIGLTYLKHQGVWSWGAQAKGTLRLYDNKHDYHLGDEAEATVWTARNLRPWLSVSGRVNAKAWGNIEGADASLNTMMTPGNRADLRGGERVELGLGANFIVPQGQLKGHRFALEALVPVYQDLDGPQLQADHRLVAGWQYAF